MANETMVRAPGRVNLIGDRTDCNDGFDDRRRTHHVVAENQRVLDAAMRGIGTAACGPDTAEEYIVEPGTHRLPWTLGIIHR